MPVYKTINFNSSTQIIIWKISESFEQLSSNVVLKEKNQLRLNGMKSELHQRAFLSVRMLLKEAGYSDFDLHYDNHGKPYFNDGKHVSITHSHHFSAIIISDKIVGIDIEKQREKIIRIADKFVSPTELVRLHDQEEKEYIKKLTVKWGAKEAIFKIRNEPGISFKDHIEIHSFEMVDATTTSVLSVNTSIYHFSIYFEEIEDCVLVYALPL